MTDFTYHSRAQYGDLADWLDTLFAQWMEEFAQVENRDVVNWDELRAFARYQREERAARKRQAELI